MKKRRPWGREEERGREKEAYTHTTPHTHVRAHTTVEAIRPSRERGLEPAYICPYKNVQSTLVQIGKTLVQTFCSGTKFCSGLLTTEVLGWAR